MESCTTENGTYSNTGVTHSHIDAKNAIATGLGNSETRWVRVLAINRWGRGQWVKASGASKPVVPGAVQNLSATAGTGPNLTVTWAQPRPATAATPAPATQWKPKPLGTKPTAPPT